MYRKKISGNPADTPTMKTVVMSLYIVYGAPHSQTAMTSLTTICEECLHSDFELEIIDVLENPLRAINDDVPIAPVLSKLSPPPVMRIAGNLSDRHNMLQALGITG